MQELDYAEMLEIPVSTVTVTKKKSFFRRPPAAENLKDRVVDSVNERVGAFVEAEDLTDPPKPKPQKRDRESVVLITEIAAVLALALTIFLTNVFMPTSAINTFIASIISPSQKTEEPAYNQIVLSSVVGSFSDADVNVSENGVISFTAEGCVYPVSGGTVESVAGEEGAYTVKIAHTSTFSSVITGLTSVYSGVGEEVKSNLPFAWSDGSAEVKVTLYDGETPLNGVTLSGEIPVWKS